MRVCPICGYVDPPYWKHVKYSYFIDSCSLENLKIMKPELYKRIISEKIVDDKFYVYRLSKTGNWIERKAKIDYAIQSWSDKCERGDKRITPKIGHLKDLYPIWNRLHPNQNKLFSEKQIKENQQKDPEEK